MTEQLLKDIANILTEVNIKPIAVHEDGTLTYIIYPERRITNITGYVVTRIDESVVGSTVILNSFLLSDPSYNVTIYNLNLETALTALTFG